MREIKFRVWDNNWQKKFLAASGWVDDDIYMSPDGKIYSMYYEEYNLLDNVEVEMFTGLLDGNGKKIYEGDIVLYHGEQREIIYAGSGFFMAKKRKISISLDFALKKLQVIGNIYENSELLK